MLPLDRLEQLSPYIARLMRLNPDLAKSLDAAGAEDVIHTAIKAEIRACASLATNQGQARFDSALRVAKQRAALILAYGDRCCGWPVMTVTGYLTDFAEAALDRALQMHWQAALAQAKITLQSHAPVGIFALAMGKMGGRELNYSSDIDIIFLFDPETFSDIGIAKPQEFANRLVRGVTASMEQRTRDGYVFRMDLRLRPDPSSSPLAVTVDGALGYYLSVAQNWERAAYIKARPTAGDKQAATAFLDELAPWIWRRTIDYAALTDLAQMKERATRHASQHAVAFEGFDVKLGRGGIREIEVYAQISQLLFGGRDTDLRARDTLSALQALSARGHITPDARRDLASAYEVLRQIEHAIQMVDDVQTHQLPDDEQGIEVIAALLSLSVDDLRQQLDSVRQRVSQHYTALLPETGASSIPALPKDILENAKCADIVQGWQDNPPAALRTPSSQHLWDQVFPDLCQYFAQESDPATPLGRLDRFLRSLPSGYQVFAHIHANPNVTRLLARIMATAPALADMLGKRPALWGPVIEPGFFDPLGSSDAIHRDVVQAMSRARDYQDSLDLARIYANEQKFRLSVQFLEGIASLDEVAHGLSDVADHVLHYLVEATFKAFTKRYGTFPGGSLTICALGKYGSRQLTMTSDLDLVFFYDAPSAAAESEQGLAASQYFSRLAQQILTAITALTSEGRLYEVDTRLRPYGNQGPLVAHIDSFIQYYSRDAWTWEYLALTRFRTVMTIGDQRTNRVEEAVIAALAAPRTRAAVAKDTLDMWQKLQKELPAKSEWDLKRAVGGMMQVELLVQALTLIHSGLSSCRQHGDIADLTQSLISAEVLGQADGDQILRAYGDYAYLQALFRLCFGGSAITDALPLHIQTHIFSVTGTSSLADALAHIADRKTVINTLFISYLEAHL